MPRVSPLATPPVGDVEEAWESPRGVLLRGDTLRVLPHLVSESVDCIFADPPFNLGKDYGEGVEDRKTNGSYVAWQTAWLSECVRLLAPGGSLFVYNLPRWNIEAAAYLSKSLVFRHWIAVEMANSMPIKGRLYPAHYSLLYFTKGAPNTFSPPRMPLVVCRHCGSVTRDYGGYKSKMRPDGRTLSDVWTDLAPVRPRRAKKLYANSLPVAMIDRVLDIATEEGDLVLDPFAGSGTTLVCAEARDRRWIGIELGSIAPARQRLEFGEQDVKALRRASEGKNVLFSPAAVLLRTRKHPKDGFECVQDGQTQAAVKSSALAREPATLS